MENTIVQGISSGHGELLGWHDPDENRKWVLQNKDRSLRDKRMSISGAVSKFLDDGDFVAFGGFGHVRVSMAAVYEIIRQKKENLAIAGKTAVYDLDLLIASGCVNKVEAAYCFGHELRGLSSASRRSVESGKTKVVAEISNAGFQWRFKAAAMGIPFMPTRVMLGTDTFERSSAKVVTDPFSQKPICLVPACYPDVAFIHVHKCDKFGNCQIDGIVVEDIEMSMAARRLIITTEEIVAEKEIRDSPRKTAIPFFLVDSVTQIPYGSHPGNMPYIYDFDEEHIAEWLALSKTDLGVQDFLDKYVYGVNSFEEYLNAVGGANKLARLRLLEQLNR